MRILLTGGCGFIGSHQAVVLLEAGHEVVVVDDLTNAKRDVIDRIGDVAGRQPEFHHLDVRDTDAMVEVMRSAGTEAIVHFAAMKHVAESVDRPVDYLHNNVAGLTSMLAAADTVGVRRLIFSSSGSVYGAATETPIPESAPRLPSNPYSRSKAVSEDILDSLCRADPRWSVVALRYFNPAGAHPSGLIGEDPTHLVTNIVPVLMEIVAGKRESLTVNGTDFPTPDGTCVRDYVHVMDVARAHALALDRLEPGSGYRALNIGRGEGVSVRDLVEATQRVFDTSITVHEGPRRQGDVPALVADTSASRAELDLDHYLDIDTILTDAWRYWSPTVG